MTTIRSVALLVLIVVGLLVAPAVSGAVANAFADDSDDSDDESATEAQSNASVGTFMQSSAADANSSVEAGMFDAKYESADDEARSAAVVERTNDLEARLETLEAERAALREQRDDIHRGEYRARMAKLAVEIQSLERSIDRTEQRAEETGVDGERLAELRANASELSGPEVAEIARALAGSNGRHGGPPDDPGNQSTDDHPGQGTGRSPGQADGDAPGNSGGNSSDERGNGDGRGNASTEPGNDSGADRGNNGNNGRGNASTDPGNDSGADRGNNGNNGRGNASTDPAAAD